MTNKLPTDLERRLPRVTTDLPTFGRPSRNLGHIFNSQLHNVDLHSSINASHPIPFTVIRQAATAVNKPMNNMITVRGAYARASNLVKSIRSR